MYCPECGHYHDLEAMNGHLRPTRIPGRNILDVDRVICRKCGHRWIIPNQFEILERIQAEILINKDKGVRNSMNSLERFIEGIY